MYQITNSKDDDERLKSVGPFKEYSSGSAKSAGVVTSDLRSFGTYSISLGEIKMGITPYISIMPPKENDFDMLVQRHQKALELLRKD